jgi:hypothetical protein
VSDELECFRKAAELGCIDFKIVTGLVHFYTPRTNSYALPAGTFGELSGDSIMYRRINRYAAAVCAAWWQERFDSAVSKTSSEDSACVRMRDAARAFGKKYGGN